MNVNELETIYKEVVVNARNAAEAEETEYGKFLVFDAAMKNLDELNNNFMAEHDGISNYSQKIEARRLYHHAWNALSFPNSEESKEFMA